MADPQIILNYDLQPSPQAQSKLQAQLAAMERSLKSSNSFNGISTNIANFDNQLARATQRIASFGAAFTALSAGVLILKSIVSYTIEADKALVDMNSTLKLSAAGLSTFSKDLFDSARATSSSFKDAAEAAQLFSRQGLTSEQVIKKTTDALTLMRISGISTKDAVEDLTNATNIFAKSGITTHDLLEKIAGVSSHFAISANDLVKGFERVGAEAADAGVSVNQLFALLTSAKQISGRSGDAVGTAFSTIFERLKNPKDVETLALLGVKVRGLGNEALPTVTILQNLAKSYDTMGDAAKSQVDKLAGGARQVNILKAAFSDLNKEQGLNSQVLKFLSVNTDDATKRILAQNQAVASLLENFKTTATQIGSNIGQATFAKPLKFALQNDPIIEAFKDADGHAKTTGGKFAQGFLDGFGSSLLIGGGPLLLAFFGQIAKKTFTLLGRDVLSQTGLLGTSSKQQTYQERIVALYNAGDEALKRQLSTMDMLVNRSAQLASGLSSASGGFSAGGLRSSTVSNNLQKPLSEAQLLQKQNELRQGFFEQEQASFYKRLHPQFRNLPLDKFGPNVVQDMALSAEQQTDSSMAEIRAQNAIVAAQYRVQNNAQIATRIRSSRANSVISALEPRGSGFAGVLGTQEGDIEAIRNFRTQSGKKLGYPAGYGSGQSVIEQVSALPLAALASQRQLRLQQYGVGASFALPFLGGAVSSLGGEGGTTRGRTVGALSGALNMGGLGAGIGSFFPGAGTLIGAGIGTAAGAIGGFVSKYSKSSEEVSQEIATIQANQQQQIQRITRAFQIQEQLNNAIKNKNVNSANDLTIEQTQNLSGLDSTTANLVLNLLKNPDGLSIATDRFTSNAAKSNTGLNLLGAVNAAGNNATSSLPFGRKQRTADSINSALPSLVAGISTLSPSQLKALQSLNSQDSEAAITSVGKLNGLSGDQLKNLVPSTLFNNFGPGFLKLLINAAIDEVKKNGIKGKVENSVTDTPAPAAPPSTSFEDLIKFIGGFEKEAKSIELTASVLSRTQAVSQRISGESPILTDIQRLRLSGQFGEQNIIAQGTAQQSADLQSGKTTLLKALGEGADTNTVSKIRSLSTLEQVQNFKNVLSTNEGNKQFPTNEATIKALEELTVKLEDAKKTQDANVEVNKITNNLLLQQLQGQKTYDYSVQSSIGDMTTTKKAFEDAQDAKLPRGTIEGLGINYLNSVTDSQRKLESITEGKAESDIFGRNLGNSVNLSQRQRDAILSQASTGNVDISGSDISGALFGNAKKAGQSGDTQGSLLGGFQSVFAGLKRDMLDFADVGKGVADSLNSNLGNAFGEFVTGAKKGKDAFRDFVTSVLSDASRMLASKAISGILSSIPGFGASSGGSLGFAAGGMVPAMLTGGEFVLGPKAARSVGYNTLRQLNGYADGGFVKGGSGVHDDVPANLPTGSFVIRKAAAQRLGGDYLHALAAGQVQHRAGGGALGGFGGGFGLWGALLGAVVGGGLGYLAGGKKGAIGGALLGGIGGGLYQGSGTSSYGAVSAETAFTPATLNVGEKAALGLGASAGLGLLAGGINDRPTSGPISLGQIPAYSAALLAGQNSAIAAGKSNGQFPYLQIGPQGQSYIQGYTDAPATRRWADGGGVDAPMITGPSSTGGGNGAAQVNIKVDINNNGNATSSATSNGTAGQPFGPDFADKLNRQIRGVVQDELVQQSRPDGFLAQKSRYVNRG